MTFQAVIQFSSFKYDSHPAFPINTFRHDKWRQSTWNMAEFDYRKIMIESMQFLILNQRAHDDFVVDSLRFFLCVEFLYTNSTQKMQPNGYLNFCRTIKASNFAQFTFYGEPSISTQGSKCWMYSINSTTLKPFVPTKLQSDWKRRIRMQCIGMGNARVHAITMLRYWHKEHSMHNQ